MNLHPDLAAKPSISQGSVASIVPLIGVSPSAGLSFSLPHSPLIISIPLDLGSTVHTSLPPSSHFSPNESPHPHLDTASRLTGVYVVQRYLQVTVKRNDLPFITRDFRIPLRIFMQLRCILVPSHRTPWISRHRRATFD